ncbi:hypothetical protein A1Q2_01761 [Trichosporon asahii var. asahii CBS 8904]|uniref:GCF C-terminal domain-containing protein n=1 Tax=Trichosporon asahii var. asahii (strain CBS 8904) TaxID=1220162 RepID=K1VWU3_TRIAC|nr:hypothetical protein A1Q2_01761 [Trichosporon asahii var. asahii CBS 8904]
MARRKQNILSDGSDSGGDCDNGSESDFDSQEDEDSRAERRLFERRQRKRPRTGRSGKDSAWEGIFGADDGGLDRRSGSGLGNRQRGGGNSRNDWTNFNAGAARLSSGIGSPMINEANDPSVGGLAVPMDYGRFTQMKVFKSPRYVEHKSQNSLERGRGVLPHGVKLHGVLVLLDLFLSLGEDLLLFNLWQTLQTAVSTSGTLFHSLVSVLLIPVLALQRQGGLLVNKKGFGRWSSFSTKSGASSLEPLAPSFNRLLTDLKDEYTRLSLDEVVVGAIDLVLKPSFDAWEPFDVSSDALLSTLMPWRTAFNLAVEGISLPIHEDRQMTAWESLLWHRWLPKVRSTINNDWSASDAWPAVHLVESWYPLLPDFIRDNVLSQLVLPKVMSAIEAWTGRGRGGDSLASVVFPWLPLLGDRHGEVLEESRRRIRSLLRRWKPADGVPQELARWRSDIFSAREWDTIIGEHVLGKLGAVLRDLVINPRDQDMSAIVNEVLPWHSLIRPSNFTRLFELEFFPKWLNVLYLWLVHPGYNGEEVAQWFELWKSLFPAEVLHHKAIAHGFETGVQLMGAALALGPSRSQDLQRPSYSPLSRSSKSSVGGSKAPSTPAPHVAVRHDDITFRNIAEDFIASKDLLMVPLGKSHSTTGKPLFRVGKTIDGKGGVTVYVGEDAVFAQGDSGSFHAVTLDDVVQRAGGAGHL